jgi:hypothetical protein
MNSFQKSSDLWKKPHISSFKECSMFRSTNSGLRIAALLRCRVLMSTRLHLRRVRGSREEPDQRQQLGISDGAQPRVPRSMWCHVQCLDYHRPSPDSTSASAITKSKLTRRHLNYFCAFGSYSLPEMCIIAEFVRFSNAKWLHFHAVISSWNVISCDYACISSIYSPVKHHARTCGVFRTNWNRNRYQCGSVRTLKIITDRGCLATECPSDRFSRIIARN